MYKQAIWGKTQARWREELHKVPVLCDFFELGRASLRRGLSTNRTVTGGKETQVLPGYLPLTDRVSLELLKKLEIEMTGKEMLPLTDAQCHLNFR